MTADDLEAVPVPIADGRGVETTPYLRGAVPVELAREAPTRALKVIVDPAIAMAVSDEDG